MSFICMWMKTYFHMKGCAPRKRYKTIWKWPIFKVFYRMIDIIALFTVTFSHLHYNVFERGCEAISGNFVVSARNCLTSTFKNIVMQMRKGNCEKGYFYQPIRPQFLDLDSFLSTPCIESRFAWFSKLFLLSFAVSPKQLGLCWKKAEDKNVSKKDNLVQRVTKCKEHYCSNTK